MSRRHAEEPLPPARPKAERGCLHCLGEGWEPVAWWQRVSASRHGGNYVEKRAMRLDEYRGAVAQNGWTPYSGVVTCRCVGGTAAEAHEQRAAQLAMEGL